MAGYVLAWPAQWAITHLGWRGALACYVVGVAALVPCALRVYPSRLRPAAHAAPAGSAPDGQTVSEIVRSTAFWALVIVFSLPPLIGYLTTIQHTLYLTARGFTAAEASLLLAVGGVLSAGGRALTRHRINLIHRWQRRPPLQGLSRGRKKPGAVPFSLYPPLLPE